MVLLIAQNKGKISTLDITRELVAKNLQAFIADLNKQENRVFTDKENIEFAILHEIMWIISKHRQRPLFRVVFVACKDSLNPFSQPLPLLQGFFINVLCL